MDLGFLNAQLESSFNLWEQGIMLVIANILHKQYWNRQCEKKLNRISAEDTVKQV